MMDPAAPVAPPSQNALHEVDVSGCTISVHYQGNEWEFTLRAADRLCDVLRTKMPSVRNVIAVHDDSRSQVVSMNIRGSDIPSPMHLFQIVFVKEPRLMHNQDVIGHFQEVISMLWEHAPPATGIHCLRMCINGTVWADLVLPESTAWRNIKIGLMYCFPRRPTLIHEHCSDVELREGWSLRALNPNPNSHTSRVNMVFPQRGGGRDQDFPHSPPPPNAPKHVNMEEPQPIPCDLNVPKPGETHVQQ